eukprot:comp162528_c0_seq1/m.49444 comp162528_c0_seq1/g.49444  ORF comp162528_c0_seq1/g.49444 comp162528_c0_seq1/m.49444 type:complete len:206 (-) comp162528_c0_seq1:3-620(-)
MGIWNEFGRRAWVVAKAKTSNGALKFSPELVRIIDESLKRARWEELQAHLKNPDTPRTLCHGDFHASNMLLRDGTANEPHALQDGLVMFDWSEVGTWEPTMDLAQTIIADVSPSLFVPQSKQLVRHYWETLIAHRVKESDYPFDACWEGFCRGAERWVWVFAVLASFPLPDVAIQYFHDQLPAFVKAIGGNRSYYQLKPIVCLAP